MPDYRASWYSQLPAFGWFDREDRPGSNALGVPDWQQGIALPSRRTLGQYFNVTGPGGQTYRLQQTDVGPANWTGRGVDISAAAAHQMGYTPKTFPTDASFTVEPAEGGSMPDMPQGQRNMPDPSLMDMLQPQQSLTDRLGGMSNSLIGLGMGMLQPYNPWAGTNAWTNALQGYQVGSALDQRAAAQRQQLATQAYDRMWRQQEAARAQSNADRAYGLQVQQFEQGNWQKIKDPESEQEGFYNARTGQVVWPQGGGQTATASTGGAYGGGAAVPFTGQGPMGVGADGTFPQSTATVARTTPQLPPELAGAPPSVRREYQKELAKKAAGGPSAHEQTAIDAADQAVTTNRQVINNLQYAKRISPNAPSGLLAPTSDVVGQAFPGIMSNETKNRLLLQNTVIGNAVEQLKAIFGGNPSEGERKILLDMQGSVNQPDAIRQEIYDRAIAAANDRLEMNRQKAEQIRGRTYYQPGGGQASQQGSGASSSAVRRYNPQTGMIE